MNAKRSLLLRACALAHPRADRPVVVALAADLVDDGASPRREALSLLSSGIAARLNLSAAPWREALAQLALPLAGFLLATLILGGTRASGWIGWSWTGGITGATLAFAGIALGQRLLALPGALLVAGLCVVDGLRDQTRWMAAFVDVLPAVAALACLLVAAAVYPRRHDTHRIAWTGAATATLVVLAIALDFRTTAGTTVLTTACALVLGFTLWSLRPSTPPPDRLAAALVLLATTPTTAWIATAAFPPAHSDPIAYAVLLGVLVTGAHIAHRLAVQRR